MKTLFQSAAKIGAGVILGIFVVLSLIAMFQEKLIYFPQPLSREEADAIVMRNPNAQSIEIRTADNTALRGWYVKNSELSASPLLIYFGGNAEELSYLVPLAEKFDGWSLALINYRGYGLSEGKPVEKNLFNDAIAVYDFFSKRTDVDRNRIVLMGRSLGTGVAVRLASLRPVKGVILVSPFDSLLSVARELYPFLPVSLLLTQRFDSAAKAPRITAPLLAIIASHDTVIHRRHSEKLVEKWGGPHTITVIEGGDHNTISDNARYWKEIQHFLVNL